MQGERGPAEVSIPRSLLKEVFDAARIEVVEVVTAGKRGAPEVVAIIPSEVYTRFHMTALLSDFCPGRRTNDLSER